MSLLFMDGFDHYTASEDKYDAVSITGGTSHNVTTEGRFTPGAYHLTGVTGGTAGNGTVDKNITTTETECIFGFAFKYDASVAFADFVFLDTGGLQQGGISINGADIDAIGKTTSVLGTATSALTVSVWQYVEVRVKAHATLGEIEIKVNGTQVLGLTGLDTRGGAMGKWRITRGAEGDDSWIDDLYILDTGGSDNNTFLGDVRVTALRPKANGTNNNFTPTGAATNYQAMDETLHDGDTTFVEAGQLGAKEDYDNTNFSDLGISPGTIFGVQTVNATKKTDAGQLKFRDQMIVGGIAYDNGTDVIASSGAYKMTTYIRDTDPSDNGAWTEAKVDAVGSGFEITFREV
jgi:hypothetical protein